METVWIPQCSCFGLWRMSNFSRDKRLLDWPKHCPALVGEITESIADGAAHEKDHVVLSRAFTVTHLVDCRRSHGRRARQ